jgi:hypothetical protein
MLFCPSFWAGFGQIESVDMIDLEQRMRALQERQSFGLFGLNV